MNRFKRDCERLTKEKKEAAEKASAYQKTNEKMRKDKEKWETEIKKYQEKERIAKMVEQSKKAMEQDSDEGSPEKKGKSLNDL